MAIDKDFVIKNGLQVNENLIFADPDTDKVGIGTTTANRKLVVIGDAEVSSNLSVGTTISGQRSVVTGVATAQSGLDVGVGGTVLGVSVINKQVGINSTNPVYTMDLLGPVSTGQTAAYIFGDVEVTGSIKAASLSGQISAGGTVGFTNVTVDNKLIANNAEVFTKFNIDDNGNKFRFLAAGDPPGIGFTQNTDNPEIYLQRGQNYRFVVDAGGFPFYIKSEPTANLSDQFNRGVEGNGAQVGIVTFKVPFDSPNKLYYQASNISGMGGTIYINNDYKDLEVGILTVTSFLDSNTQADFEQIYVSGIGTVNNLKGPQGFSVSAGILTVRQDQTALIGVSTGTDKINVDQATSGTYQLVFSGQDQSAYQQLYIDGDNSQLSWDASTNELSALRFIGNLSGIATGADNINIDATGGNTEFQITFSDPGTYGYQRQYIDSESGRFTYNPSTNTLSVTNITATTVTAGLAGTATNADNINVDEKNDDTDYQVLFSDNQGAGYQRPYIDSDSGQFKYNPSTQTLTAENIAGAGDNITNLDGSNISQGTIDADRIPDASTTAQGVSQLYNTYPPISTSTTEATTPNLVKQVYDEAIGVIPADTKMVFYQSNAPTGWTKITTHNNKAIRVVSGTGGGTGGNTAFTSIFSSSRSVPLLQHSHNANASNQTANHSHTVNANTTSGGGHAHNISDPGHNHSYQRAGADTVEKGNRSNNARGLGFQTRETWPNQTTGINVSSSGSNHGHNISANAGNNNANHKHNISIGNNGESGASMNFSVNYIDVIICNKDTY